MLSVPTTVTGTVAADPSAPGLRGERRLMAGEVVGPVALVAEDERSLEVHGGTLIWQ